MKDYIWIRQLGMSLQVSGSLIMAITFAVQHWRVHFKHVKEPNFSKPGKTSRWLKAEFGLTLLSIALIFAGFLILVITESQYNPEDPLAFFAG